MYSVQYIVQCLTIVKAVCPCEGVLLSVWSLKVEENQGGVYNEGKGGRVLQVNGLQYKLLG